MYKDFRTVPSISSIDVQIPDLTYVVTQQSVIFLSPLQQPAVLKATFFCVSSFCPRCAAGGTASHTA